MLIKELNILICLLFTLIVSACGGDTGGEDYSTNSDQSLGITPDSQASASPITAGATQSTIRVQDYLVTTTGTGPLNLGMMGFAYDPVSQKMVAWEGGSQVYILDTGTWKWTIIPGTGDAPGDPNKTGTYGRFVYIESLDKFALVNGPSENVYLLELRDEGPNTLSNAIWTTVPNSWLDAIKYDWSPNPTPGTFSGIFAWSGGALDTKRDRLLIFGGGHGDYGGQEIYAFDFSTMAWSRISEPEDYNALDLDCTYGGRTDNNLPKSSHTYDRLAYIESIDSLCDTRGAVGFRQCGSAVEMACYSFTKNEWSYLEESMIEPVGGAGAFSALHPISKDWWVHGTGDQSNARLAKYNVTTKQWSEVGGYDNLLGDTNFKTAEIDPNRNLLIVGKGNEDGRALYALPLDGL